MILFYLKMKPSGEVSFFLFDQKPNQILNQQIASHKATPIKCLDQDNISAQLKLEGWLYNVLSFYLYSFQRRGTLLQVILERRLHFIGYLREEEPFYWVNLRGSWRSFYLYPKLGWRLAGVSFFGPYSTWRAGHLDQVILLVLPNTPNSRS